MRAISLWRPWPWTFISADKRIDNRGEEITYRGDVVFHGAKQFDHKRVPMIEKAARAGGFRPPLMYPSAHATGLLFVATIVDCLDADTLKQRIGKLEVCGQCNGSGKVAVSLSAGDGPGGYPVDCASCGGSFVMIYKRQLDWIIGPWCMIVTDVRPFAKPIPWRGKQGWFDVPDDIVREALAA